MGAEEHAAAGVPDRVVEYLGRAKTLTLATAAGDAPHATTLVYVNDGSLLYVWLHSSSVTARQLERNPRVAFAIDEYAEDWRQTRGIQGSGECVPVVGEELARAGDLLGAKYPDLRPGASGSVAFYRITPRELHFIDNTAGGSEPAPDEYRRESILEIPGGLPL